MSARGWPARALVAAAVAAGVLAGAWALQAATLPAPDPGNLVAARAMAWLAGDRMAESTFSLGKGLPVRSRCSRTWVPADGTRELAVRLTAAGRTRVIPLGRPSATIRGKRVEKPRGALLARLELAGCPPVLASQIAGLVRHGSGTAVGQARLDGRPALTLRIWTRAGHVTVYVDADTKRPLAVILAGKDLTGRARLRLADRSTGTGARAGGA